VRGHRPRLHGPGHRSGAFDPETERQIDEHMKRVAEMDRRAAEVFVPSPCSNAFPITGGAEVIDLSPFIEARRLGRRLPTHTPGSAA
jgi:hypothetical protein